MVRFLDRFLKITSVFTTLFLIYSLFHQDYSAARIAYKEWYAVVGLLLFNTTHVFITLISLSCIPEFKQLSLLKQPEFYIRCACVFLGTSFVTYALVGPYRDAEWADLAMKVFLYVGTIHHSMMQTFGLSVNVDLQNRTINQFEKKTVFFLIGTSILYFAGTRFSFHAILQAVAGLVIIAWVFCALSILKRTKVGIRAEKSFFLLRYLCFSLCFLNPILTLITMNFHGIEYLNNFLKKRKASKISNRNYLLSSILLWGFVPLTAVFFHPEVILKLVGQEQFLSSLFLLKVVMIGLNVTHYYVDARIYRFKDPDIREKIGPLLISKTAA
jgi:hypothetical protein